jgi:hypothetical protein
VIVPSYHYMIGPTVALLALGVIVLLCRWTFSTSHRDRRTASRREAARFRGDYGLLVPVASAPAGEVEHLRARLVEAGLRCTVADGEQPGTRVVLVFRADADRARSVVLG